MSEMEVRVAQQEEIEQGAEQAPAKPKDAEVHIWTASSGMEAFIRVNRPEEGGAHVTEEEIRAELEKQGIVAGIEKNVGRTIARLHLYDKGFTIAKGIPAKNGADGVVEDRFPREKTIQLEENERGEVDFKNLNLVHDAKEGEVICRISLPTKAEPGTDVFGRSIEGTDGVPAQIPQGKNTHVNEEGTELIASCGGNVVFENDVFRVERELRIEGSVDNSVGNLNFSGDVIIQGDVCEGYEVHAGGDVHVYGSVEGAVVTAGGSIRVDKGMNGMLKGSLEAGEDVRCRFLENCSVSAGKNVLSESILNSNISAGDKIDVNGRRGVIVGCTCSAGMLVRAKSVGAMSHVLTEFYLGVAPKVQERLQQAQQEEKDLTEQVDFHEKDILYLVQSMSQGRASIERLRRLKQIRAQLAEDQKKLSELQEEIADLQGRLEKGKQGRLSCMSLYPPVKITIGNVKTTISKQDFGCSFYFKDGEIVRGVGG